MKRRTKANPAVSGLGTRAHALIEAMLCEMQRAMEDPTRLESPEWERLFGAKQSMVVNIQKLVQALAAIPVAETPHSSDKSADQKEQALSPQEMELLQAWLAETNPPG